MKKLSKKQQLRNEIKQQIKDYFKEAQEKRNTDPKRAHQCVKKAYKLALKIRFTFPKKIKRSFCKHCLHLRIPGKNYRVRTTGKTITYTCLDCGKWQRFGY
jgi:RNase P subunit RPR2